MSSAMNHRKRSHRSQKAHYMAGSSLYKGRLIQTQQNEGGLLGGIGRMIRRNRETKSDID